MLTDERGAGCARVGRFLVVLAGAPRFGGAVTPRPPVRNALGRGVEAPAVRGQLIGEVLLGRRLSAETAVGLAEGLDESEHRRGVANCTTSLGNPC